MPKNNTFFLSYYFITAIHGTHEQTSHNVIVNTKTIGLHNCWTSLQQLLLFLSTSRPWHGKQESKSKNHRSPAHGVASVMSTTQLATQQGDKM